MRTNPYHQKSGRARQPIFRRRARKHDALLISSLALFNFRPPIILEFPGERRRTWAEVRVTAW